MGRAFSESDGFKNCMAERTLKKFCLNDADVIANSNDKATVEKLAAEFAGSGYDMKHLIAATVAECVK